jgi:hypothetical protein
VTIVSAGDYYFVVTALNAEGAESLASNQVEYVAAAASPTPTPTPTPSRHRHNGHTWEYYLKSWLARSIPLAERMSDHILTGGMDKKK